MDYKDAAINLEAIVSIKSGGDIDRLVERAEHVRLAVLKRRAGNTEYQLQLTKLACDAVVRYVKDDKPPDDLRRRNIARAIARLKNAGSFDASAEWRKTSTDDTPPEEK